MQRLVGFLVSAALLIGCARTTTLSLASGDPCETPLGHPGTCEVVRNCTFVQKILNSPNFTHLDTEYLEELKCGEMMHPTQKRPIPLICCPRWQNVPECGPIQFKNRIWGGEETELGDHPWAALLFYNVGKNRTVPKCGGTLVSASYVITAAHCTVDRPNWKLLYARFSELNTSSTQNCTTIDDKEVCRQDYDVEAIIPHPLYDMKNISRPNDICLLRLAQDVTFTDYVRPICLPSDPEIRQMPFVGEEFTVVGWGETETRRASDVLLQVDLPGLRNDDCSMAYAVANVTLSDKQLCVGGLNGTDSCRGDSGGPLMRQVPGDRWYLVGVVSFGARFCGTKNLPGVYTSVVKYLDWVESEVYDGQYL
ncbi:CLIP domain-containing serine protease B15-like [Anopheles cruzii]|uniref:CLIP domain-containing serine protease B15-like n=1 Tax=Anopheles cruzii TaxID=68878 RepID=UPI0022EC81D0|nr:CLIP domain-containing serine protease B15-like [Anopheles cruzii]